MAARMSVCSLLLALLSACGGEPCTDGEVERDGRCVPALEIARAVLFDQGCGSRVCAGLNCGPLGLLDDDLQRGEWDLGYSSEYRLCLEIHNLFDLPSNPVDPDDVRAGRLQIEIQEFDVGLGFASELPIALGSEWLVGSDGRWTRTMEYESWIGNGGMGYVCIVLASAAVGDAIRSALPGGGSSAVSASVSCHGEIADAAVRSNEFPFTIDVGSDWLVEVPEDARCCEPPESGPCFAGQDRAVDCRLVRHAFDELHGLAPWTDPEGNVLQRSQCCPQWPEYRYWGRYCQ